MGSVALGFAGAGAAQAVIEPKVLEPIIIIERDVRPVVAPGGAIGRAEPSFVVDAYRDALAAAPDTAIAITPTLALERLVEPVAKIVDGLNERRLQAVLSVPGGIGAAVVRAQFAGTFGARRRALLETIDRSALRQVWPRGSTGYSLEVELFVRRRVGVETGKALAPLRSVAQQLFGQQAKGAAELSPVGIDECSRRAYALLALAGSDTSGALPRLLAALGDESGPALPGRRQLMWLELVRLALDPSQPRRYADSRRPRRERLELDCAVYATGTSREWGALQEGVAALHEALRSLDEHDRHRGGALTRFFKPLFQRLREFDERLQIVLTAVERGVAAESGTTLSVLHGFEAEELMPWFAPQFAPEVVPAVATGSGEAEGAQPPAAAALPFTIVQRTLPSKQGEVIWFDYARPTVARSPRRDGSSR